MYDCCKYNKWRMAKIWWLGWANLTLFYLKIRYQGNWKCMHWDLIGFILCNFSTWFRSCGAYCMFNIVGSAHWPHGNFSARKGILEWSPLLRVHTHFVDSPFSALERPVMQFIRWAQIHLHKYCIKGGALGMDLWGQQRLNEDCAIS